MLLWIMLGVVGLIIFMCLVGSNCIENALCGAGLTLFIGVIIIGIYIAAVGDCLRDRGTPTRTVQHELELVAMRMGSSISGRFFFLGSGSFGSNEQYVYMYRTKTGALKRGRENIYKSTVREIDDGRPRRVYDKRYVTSWLLPWEIKMRDSAPEFIVPVGSVTYKFEIN